MSTYSKNGAIITVTPTTAWSGTDRVLTTEQINSGFNTNIDTVSLSGKTRRSKPSVVAEVVVVANSGKYFSIPPYLKTKSRKLSLRLRDKVNQKLTVGDGVFYTSYTYDLMFVSNNKSTTVNALNADIKYVTKIIPTVETKIHSIDFGSTYIASVGESRRIKVIGEKDAIFGLAVNETHETKVTIGDDTFSNFDKVSDESILPTFRNSHTTKYNYGKEINIIKNVIPSSGVYEFNQIFPSTTVRKTAIATTASSATDVLFTNITGVRKGDRMYYDGLADTTVITVSALEPGGVANKLTLSETVSITKGKVVEFKRNRVYSIDIIPDLTSTLGSQIPTTDPEYRLYQYLDPTLTITHSITGTDLTVTKLNDVNTDLGRGAEHIISYTGKPNMLRNSKIKNVKDKFSVKLEISCVPASGPAHTFTAKIAPIFSNAIRRIHATTATGAVNTNAVISNWTNSITEFNGGTRLNITGIRLSAVGSATINLFYDVDIAAWGNKDVNMELDLDTILTNA